jgi:hypothetical protein
MPTTTNYGWTTPADTDLVKDGASAIRTLGNGVDTTVKALNPETTLGDISYRSSTSNTKTRLAIGTSGQVLTVSSGVPAWTTLASGGMTLINSGGTALSGSSTSVSSIPSSYKNLHIYVINFQQDDTNRSISLRFNSVTSSSYGYSLFRWSSGGTATTSGGNTTSISIHQLNDDVNNGNFAYIFIPDYANTNTRKMTNSFSYGKTSTNWYIESNVGVRHDSNDAISSLQFITPGIFTGGTVYVYGAN